MNDAKGSSEALTETVRRDNQAKRFKAIMDNTWTQGGGGGAKLDPVLVELRAVMQVARAKVGAKAKDAPKSLADIRKAYGTPLVDAWLEAAKAAVLLRIRIADATPEDVEGIGGES